MLEVVALSGSFSLVQVLAAAIVGEVALVFLFRYAVSGLESSPNTASTTMYGFLAIFATTMLLIWPWFMLDVVYIPWPECCLG